MSTATVTKSFCVICDAEPGACSHNTHRYLEDIQYIAGPVGGWIVPDHERARWDAAPLTVTPQPVMSPQARDIEDLVTSLSDIVYMDVALEARFRSAHELDPVQTSRLAVATLDGARRGSLTNPGGYLAKRLGEIERSKTKAP